MQKWLQNVIVLSIIISSPSDMIMMDNMKCISV